MAPVMAAIFIVLEAAAEELSETTVEEGVALILNEEEDGKSLLLIADSAIGEEKELGPKVVVDTREAWPPERKVIVEDKPTLVDDDWKPRGLLTASGGGVPAGGVPA